VSDLAPSDFSLKLCVLIASTETVIGVLSKVMHISLNSISNQKNGLLHGCIMLLFIIIVVSFIIDDDDSRHGSSSATNTTYCYFIPLMYPLRTKEMCTCCLVNNQSAYTVGTGRSV
jgi:hypothetical protein